MAARFHPVKLVGSRMDTRIALSQRLQAVADMVPPGGIIADIGCDHGKVAIALLYSGKARCAICGDISAASLDKARILACECGMEDRVSLRAGDGLAVLQPGEADAAVIAGMGGMLIADILEQGTESAPDTLVLSPNRDAAKLRRTLAACGYRITDEVLVCEAGHFYPIILAVRGQGPALSEAELEFGPVLLQKKPETLRQLMRRRVAETEAVRERVAASSSPRKAQLLKDAEARLQKYTEVQKWL